MKPLLEGPNSIHTGGLYLASVGNGGGSRARMSARLGGGDGCWDGGSERIAFIMNQLFLFFSGSLPNDGEELFRVIADTVERTDWDVPSSDSLLLFSERYQPDNSFPNKRPS